MTLALEGIKVLDLSKTIGMYSTMILADMGAEVLRIEETPGPRSRMTMPIEEDKFLAFNSTNRNKKAIALNLKREEAKEIFYKLAEDTDVIIEDFRPGVTKRLGINYEAMSSINPGIIYCSISGYGQNGPYRLLAGHDPNYLSVSGFLGVCGAPDGTFVLPGVQVADLGGGSMQAVIGILMALLARERIGKGQYVDISMTDGMISWLAFIHGAIYFATGLQPKRGARPSLVFETKDKKWICICPGEPHLWERLCRAIGLEEYIEHRDAVYANVAFLQNDEDLMQKQRDMLPRMAEVFRTKTRDEWFHLLSQVDSCVSPVYDFGEVFSDPQVLQRNMVVELDHPTQGRVKQIGIGIKLSETPGQIRSFAPHYAQHTDEILLGLGYTEQQINGLREAEAIK